MSLRHFSVFEPDDDDPMLSAVNLVDVFLVLVVALLAAVKLSGTPASAQATPADNAPVELTLTEAGEPVRYQGSGQTLEGQGVRAGVAYRLRDGSIVYVPEQGTAPTPGATP
ncbi:MAG TPA: hypothetical protein DCL01_12220 [Thauera sp.]|nr:hypothetical protein [Thauera sp.]HHW62853.1 DUF2149 domain-containing protein [Rhodocyclaceae bacterium]